VRARRLARSIAANQGRAIPQRIPRFEVAAVTGPTTEDPDDPWVVTLRRSDGTEFPVYPVDGTLPAVGDVVPVFANGGDPFVMSTRVLVEGNRQSPGFQSGPLGRGWYIGADGDVEFHNGTFRGTVEGALFQTASGGGRVEIAGGDDARFVRLYTGNVDEVTPAHLQGLDDAVQAVIEIASPSFTVDTVDKVAYLRLGIDYTTGRTFGDLEADDLRVNGVSYSTPPFSMKRRVAGQTITSSSTGMQAILFDTDHLVHWQSGISYNGSNGTWSIKTPGIFDVFGTLGWNDASNDTGSRELRIVENGDERLMDSRNATLGRRTVHNFHDTIIAPEGTDTASPWTVQIKASQHNGLAASLDITGRASIRRWSGVDGGD
jgi:hypothetical protein